MNVTVTRSENIVTAAEMQAIEARLFEAGIPVAALMEKVGQRLTERIESLFPPQNFANVFVLVGPGHNGGDALVVARELFERGYSVQIYRPLPKSKSLTQAHLDYAMHIGIEHCQTFEASLQADFIIDGLFGFGLDRLIEGELASLIQQINQASIPVVSIDIPSGLQTDTGEVLGTAIAATYTLCLGLWKRAFFQEQALQYLGQSQLIPFGIPKHDQQAVLGTQPACRTIPTPDFAQLLRRSPATHKYEVGSTLLICGSATYPGAAILAAQAARATGVGMLYVAVPGSIRDLVISQVPDAVAIACPETESGAIAQLPSSFSLEKITSAAIGPGLTTEASSIVHQSLSWDMPLVIDADALNILAQTHWQTHLNQRNAPTVLTPHWGEFKRLFPDEISSQEVRRGDRITLLAQCALPLQTTVVLKGAKSIIKGSTLEINSQSTPALARGGSGDVLTGILAGLLAQNTESPYAAITAAVWWHAKAAQIAAQTLTSAGVSPTTLIQTLLSTLQTLQYA